MEPKFKIGDKVKLEIFTDDYYYIRTIKGKIEKVEKKYDKYIYTIDTEKNMKYPEEQLDLDIGSKIKSWSEGIDGKTKDITTLNYKKKRYGYVEVNYKNKCIVYRAIKTKIQPILNETINFFKKHGLKDENIKVLFDYKVFTRGIDE